MYKIEHLNKMNLKRFQIWKDWPWTRIYKDEDLKYCYSECKSLLGNWGPVGYDFRIVDTLNGRVLHHFKI